MGWFKVVEVPNKQADVIANKLEQAWLTRYPWPVRVQCDRGNEFMAKVRNMVINEYNA